MKKLFVLFAILAGSLFSQEKSVKIREFKFDLEKETFTWKVEVGEFNSVTEKFKKKYSTTLKLDLKSGAMTDGKNVFPFHQVERLIWHERMSAVQRYLAESSFWFIDPKVRDEYFKLFELLKETQKNEKVDIL